MNEVDKLKKFYKAWAEVMVLVCGCPWTEVKDSGHQIGCKLLRRGQ